MITVYKYHLPTEDVVKLQLPKFAKVLHVNVQNDLIYLWALVDSENVLENRTFRIAGTGHDIGAYESYIGTVHIFSDSLVFHIFEV